MRIVVISDTHGGHRSLGTLQGDVLIHCGDIENLLRADPDVFRDVDDWFGDQRFEQIYCIGGNHDTELERRAGLNDQPFANAIWLHERAVTYRGVTFYGASWVPLLRGLPFYADDMALSEAWSRIPGDVDVLITHTPPAGMLDVSGAGISLGCPHLSKRLEVLSPALHCFGHVHKSAGHQTLEATTYGNASVVNSKFEVVYPPFVFDLPGGDKASPASRPA